MDSVLFKPLLFGIISMYLVFISRVSIRVFRSHGFYRFFAWESITALILVNIGTWFSHPFSILQLFSWMLLVVSLFLLVNGIHALRLMGRQNDQRQDSTLHAFEKTTVLVTSGMYKYIRHPLYSSLLFLAWGAFLKDVSWTSICLVAVATMVLVLTGKADEAECARYFGSSYKVYMGNTKMFIPFLF
jgi:protein-S-isoprenylcysteine O-methyltransferase Ste14